MCAPYVIYWLVEKKHRSQVCSDQPNTFPYNQGWGKTDNAYTADILQEAEVHILHLLMSSNFYDCRTHRVPTYPWYFPSSSSRPVSDYYYKYLIFYHIQAWGSPQPIHFLKAHHVSSPNTDENTNTKTKTVTKTMTKTKTPREWLKQ